MITFTTELTRIPGTTGRFADRLLRLRIRTVGDLLMHFPTRYEDFSAVVPVAELQTHQTATVRGVIRSISTRRTWRKHMLLLEALIADETGTIKALWFNQPFLARVLRPGLQANFAGKVLANDDELYLSNPAYEFVPRNAASQAVNHTARLVPIYPETRGLTSRGIRFLVKLFLRAVGSVPDFVPPDIRSSYNLPELREALANIHFPKSMNEAEDAKRRFAFAHLLLLQLANGRMRRALAREETVPIRVQASELETLIARLPFRLMPSQETCLREIVADLEKPHPMNRLLQGDVGSGKTVVAALAALLVSSQKKQTAFMAPTEVLARQHYRTITTLTDRLTPDSAPHIGLLLAAETRAFYGANLEERVSKHALRSRVADGTCTIAIGTHALIQAHTRFKDLALVVIDEQHRFGVDQRAALVTRRPTPDATAPAIQEKNMRQTRTGESIPKTAPLPHFLSMSATPIPRTLSLTLFGDLDLSTITELPAGRKTIVTKVVAPENRSKAYAFIDQEIEKGRQVFVICPRIEPALANGGETLSQPTRTDMLLHEAKTVKAEYERLSKKVFPNRAVGMLHGKMKSAEKERVMAAFTSGATNILVSTSVIEVGVDVPNASVMVIESAERFGLAQLYQFRGRIGRGEHQSFCLLFTESTSDATKERLEALLAAKNGFALAELDLKLRGPGQFIGERQTGLPDLAMKSLGDIALIRDTKNAAELLFSRDVELQKYPLLQAELARFTTAVHLE